MLSLTNKKNYINKNPNNKNNNLESIKNLINNNNYTNYITKLDNDDTLKTQNINIIASKNTSNISSQNILKTKNLNYAEKLEKSFAVKSNDNKNLLIPYTIEFKHSYTLNSNETKILNNKVTDNKNYYNDNKIIYSLFNSNKNYSNIGKGLNNVGNTCFLNSSLQALIHCTPLTNIFFNMNYIKECNLHNSSSNSISCMLCNLGKVILTSLSSNSSSNNNTYFNKMSSSFTPSSITQNIRCISKFLRIGRQEDAHEFIIKLLEVLESNYSKYMQIKNKNFIKDNLEDKNIINIIFKGKTFSIVECGSCKNKSETECDINHLSLVMNK